ncbi:rhomboid family intramembrane serine protease [Planctomicrobium sp. SH527]|uniref:rhomboid family intramembrane serine protease n=1 Tax=Planctomicrobium sp. SH527 TaxID=3448123 RepID=UPI003F5C67DF
MFIPYTTDAPLYYRPIATLTLIGLNFAIFIVLATRPELHQNLSLPHGQGLTPISWVTSNFVHANPGHLVGNMIFLWCFGLIVEGKIGWARFAFIYLAIGIIQCVTEQFLFWNSSGVSCGASAVIFGLMTMCLIWAPKSELSVFYAFMLRFGVMEISILWFAAMNLAFSGLIFVMDRSDLSELFHLMGAAVGLAIACYMIRAKTVDCEGWDLFTVLKNETPIDKNQFSWQHQRDSERRDQRRSANRVQTKKSSSSNLVALNAEKARFPELAAQGKPHAAFQILQQILRKNPEYQAPPNDLLAVARGLRKRKEWESATECYRLMLKQTPDHPSGRLELAEIYAYLQSRPAAAQRLVDQISIDELTPTEQSRLSQLNKKITALIESGVIEFQEHH